MQRLKLNILEQNHTLTLKPVKNVYHSLLPEFLGELAQIFEIDEFVETGTFRGNTAAAARHIFRTIHTIELSSELYQAARHRFTDAANCHVYQGDSATVLRKILPQVEGRMLLWLDAHYSEGDTARGDVNTPILTELQALEQSSHHDAVILIDDVRLFQPVNVDTSQSPTLQGYPTLHQIQAQIRQINRDYQFVVLGDLALAYPSCQAAAVSPLMRACTVSRLFDDGGILLDDLFAMEEIIGAAQGQERNTIEILAKGILGSGDSPVGGHYRLWYGLTLIKQKKYTEACHEFMQAFERGCNHWRVFWYLAQGASHIQRNDVAKKAIRLVTETAPDFRPAQSFLRQISVAPNNLSDTIGLSLPDSPSPVSKDDHQSNGLDAIEVFPDSREFDDVGYDDIQSKTNGEWESITHFIKNGDVVFDVGANKGEWSSLVFSKRPGVQIHAFEPVPPTFSILEKNLKSSNIFLHNIAISDVCGERDFYFYDQNAQLSELSTFYRRNAAVENSLNIRPVPIQVQTQTLDQFCVSHAVPVIDFLKIDTEGAELVVLRGMSHLLGNHKIRTIQFEYGGCYLDAGTTLRQVCQLLSGYGYVIFRLVPGGLVHIENWRESLENYRYSNYLAVAQSEATGYATIANLPIAETTAAAHPVSEKPLSREEKTLCHGIVFSKDRAMQLDALLHSFLLHCQDADSVSLHVLYTTSSKGHAQQYQQLNADYTAVQFQEERNFQTDLLRLVEQAHYVLFLVDDTIFVQDFSILEIIETLDQAPAAMGFSLRLGRNTTYCYMAGVAQNLPEFREAGSEILEYDWTTAGHDFGYPLEVSSSVYRTRDLLPLLTQTQFSNPNTLELSLDSNKIVYNNVRSQLLCFSQSAAFSAPVNMVQTAWRNKAGNNISYSSDSLARMYAAGDRIDVAAFSGFVPNGVHQETPLEFRRLNKSVSRMAASRVASRPTISVVIITYNRSQWLGEAIQSALNQEYPADEILVIDDGSPTDASAQVVRSFSDDRVRYIKKEKNEGRPNARNTGIEQAIGDFILWLDDDDLLLPQTTQHYLALLQKESALEIIYGKLRYFESQAKQLGDIYDPTDWSGKTADLLRTLAVGSPIPNPGALVKRSLYKKIGGYNSHFQRAEDYEFWTRAGGSATMKKLDEFVCLYRIHPDNVSFGDTVDLSYESSVIKKLVGRHGFRTLFSNLDWRNPQKAEATARLHIARSFLKYDDYYNAVKVIEPIAVEQLTPAMVELLSKGYLFLNDTEQLNRKLPIWARAKIDQQFLSRYTAVVNEYRATLNRAYECLAQKNYSGAQVALDNGRRQYGNTADVLVLMAQVARQQGNWQRAFDLLKKAVHCAPAHNGTVQLALSLTQSEQQRQEIIAIQKRLLSS